MDELRAEAVRVEYADLVAVRDVDLVVHPGQLISVTGPSGAGKSSLLWALAGALEPAAGQVLLADEPMGGRERAAGRGVALVPQGNGLASSLTAAENVLVPLLSGGVPADEAYRRTADALALVGLE